MKRYPLANRIHGHVSAIGGPTPGDEFCITYSSGATEVPMEGWQCLAMSDDGKTSRVYVKGNWIPSSATIPSPTPTVSSTAALTEPTSPSEPSIAAANGATFSAETLEASPSFRGL